MVYFNHRSNANFDYITPTIQLGNQLLLKFYTSSLVGLLCLQGKIFSKAREALRTPNSSYLFPIIWRPTGRLPLVKPHGTDAAGCCVRLKGMVKSQPVGPIGVPAISCGPIPFSIPKAGIPVVGVRRKSYSSKTFLIWSYNSLRLYNAFT
jgi:hypothetical protein